MSTNQKRCTEPEAAASIFSSASRISNIVSEREAITISYGGFRSRKRSTSSHNFCTQVMFFICIRSARSLRIVTMPAPGSTAVISLTRGASGIASVPGPEPISSTRESGLISSESMVIFTRSSYSLLAFLSYRSAFSNLFQLWEGSSAIVEDSWSFCRCFHSSFQSGSESAGAGGIIPLIMHVVKKRFT